VVEQTGVLTRRSRRVLDSTILADAVATQDTVTQLVAAVRRVRRLMPQAREVELCMQSKSSSSRAVRVRSPIGTSDALALLETRLGGD
jgi:hypothetical protein